MSSSATPSNMTSPANVTTSPANATTSPANPTPSDNGSPSTFQYPNWKDPLHDWQVVCSAGLYNVTDLCCAAQNGSVWADNSTSFGSTGQHNCMFNTTGETAASSAINTFNFCVRNAPGNTRGTICDTKKPGSAKRMAMATAWLVWVAAGCALAL
ncbi:hypothetical protein Q8F55_001500 [Vanrija albida]|uniref:Extracellular membrane protein CFEM domain-containing protein n=1 Tax=Vanrija albida TaxID=181172 RepID=A0ABR3QH19_9TREE